MINAGDWLPLSRKVLNNPVVTKDAEYFAVWIWLLLNAAYRPCDVIFNGARITLKPGQLVTSKNQIANALKIEGTKVQRIISTLQNALQIEQQASTKNRLITITNWELYQNVELQSAPQNEPQMHHDCTTSAPPIQKKERKKEIYTLTGKNAGAHAREPEDGVIYFEPPTLDEVKTYAEARELRHVDAERFYNWFKASDWMRGRTRIVDWQSELLNWERRETTEAKGKARGQPQEYRKRSDKNFEERNYTEAELKSVMVSMDDLEGLDL